MKRLLATQYGFFGFAAVICFATVLVIEPEHRWISLGLGSLYAVLSVLFLLDDISRGTRAMPLTERAPEPSDDQVPFAPPPAPGRDDTP
jgi:hypothetical protein